MACRDVLRGLARALDGQAIYDRGNLVGFIVARRHGFDAIAADGTAIGKFNTCTAAARALLDENREAERHVAR